MHSARAMDDTYPLGPNDCSATVILRDGVTHDAVVAAMRLTFPEYGIPAEVAARAVRVDTGHGGPETRIVARDLPAAAHAGWFRALDHVAERAAVSEADRLLVAESVEALRRGGMASLAVQEYLARRGLWAGVLAAANSPPEDKEHR